MLDVRRTLTRLSDHGQGFHTPPPRQQPLVPASGGNKGDHAHELQLQADKQNWHAGGMQLAWWCGLQPVGGTHPSPADAAKQYSGRRVRSGSQVGAVVDVAEVEEELLPQRARSLAQRPPPLAHQRQAGALQGCGRRQAHGWLWVRGQCTALAQV